MFALIDCNNFYASCERVFRPELIGKPIAIMSNNDGCIIARSNEAKALGIPMGAPVYKFKALFKKHDVHVFSSNYALYGDMSNRVMNILATYTPDIEIYSIDEAFLLFRGFGLFDMESYATEIRRKVERSTGIPISIGIAPTKALAKVANRFAKKDKGQSKGVFVINNDAIREYCLKNTDIADLWGVGRQHAKRLKANQVHTVYDFTQLPDEWVRKKMAIVGLRLKKELQGVSTLTLDDIKPKKNISTTRSFDTQYTAFEDLRERISTFTIVSAEKLRRQHSFCNMLMVYIRTNPHREDLPQYTRNIVLKTSCPTDSSIQLVKLAVNGLKKIFRPGLQYKKAGVILMGITSRGARQLSVFEEENPRHEALMKTVDHLNSLLGQQKIKYGCQDLSKTWKMRQERLSPCYTTRLKDIIEVKV